MLWVSERVTTLIWTETRECMHGFHKAYEQNSNAAHFWPKRTLAICSVILILLLIPGSCRERMAAAKSRAKDLFLFLILSAVRNRSHEVNITMKSVCWIQPTDMMWVVTATRFAYSMRKQSTDEPPMIRQLVVESSIYIRAWGEDRVRTTPAFSPDHWKRKMKHGDWAWQTLSLVNALQCPILIPILL